MIEVDLSLFERQNICYRNFLRVSKQMLDSLDRQDFDHASQLERQRNSIIKTLEKLPVGEPKSSVDILLTKENQSLLRHILDLDKELVRKIEILKNDAIHKLQEVQHGRRTLQAYHSPADAIDAAVGTKILDVKT